MADVSSFTAGDTSAPPREDGTLGNAPSAANPAGIFTPTAPMPQPLPVYSDPDYTAGSYGNYPNPGMVATAGQVSAQLGASAAAVDKMQAQAGEFIVENGAAVLDGHTTVGVETFGPGGSDPDTSGPDGADA